MIYVYKFYNPFQNHKQTKSTIIAGPMNISSVSLIVTGFPRQVIPLYTNTKPICTTNIKQNQQACYVMFTSIVREVYVARVGTERFSSKILPPNGINHSTVGTRL